MGRQSRRKRVTRQEREEAQAKYLPKVQAASKGAKPGHVYKTYVWHETDCPYPKGLGPCTCHPDEIEVEVIPVTDPGRN